MADRYEGVRTDDVALVAYLRLMGHHPESVFYDLESNVCRWEYGPDSVEEAETYLEDQAVVNPRRFTRSFGAAKREMFEAKRVAENESHQS